MSLSRTTTWRSDFRPVAASPTDATYKSAAGSAVEEGQCGATTPTTEHFLPTPADHNHGLVESAPPRTIPSCAPLLGFMPSGAM